jgi:hypothetical protein
VQRLGYFLLGLLIPAWILCSWAQAATRFFIDFDNTIVETRSWMGGTFVTKFVLFRIGARHSLLENDLIEPEIIEVTPIEMERMRSELALNERTPGNIATHFTLSDGSMIIPGHYFIRPLESHINFRSHSDLSKNHLLDQLNLALGKAPQDAWKGPFFEVLRTLLSHEESVPTVAILTARDQKREFIQFWQRLKDLNYIEHIPNPDLHFGVNAPAFDIYGGYNENAKRKRGVLEDAIKSMLKVPVNEHDLTLAPSGRGFRPQHSVIFVDDQESNLEQAIELFRRYARLNPNPRVPIKFGVFSMGSETEMRSARRPRFGIMREDGTFRPATPGEIHGELKPKCSTVLGQAAQEDRFS